MSRPEEVAGPPAIPREEEGAQEWRRTFGPQIEAEARAMFRSATAREFTERPTLTDRPKVGDGIRLDPKAWAGLEEHSRWYMGERREAIEAAMEREADRLMDATLRALAPGDARRAIALARAWEV